MENSFNRIGIYHEIDDLRETQIKKLGYDSAHDDKNSDEDWVETIIGYATEPVACFRTRLLRVASLAVAGIEAIDRRNKERPCRF
jgi:hypothetical protein